MKLLSRAIGLSGALFLVGVAVMAQPAPTLMPERLRTEYLENPLGLDEAHPRLSWVVTSGTRNARQSAYQIVVGTSEAVVRDGRGDVWDSGRIVSGETAQIRYGGPALASGQMLWWAVRVWDAADAPSPWSAPARWEMGLLTPGDWHGHWIGRSPFSSETAVEPLPLLRRAFAINGRVKRARAYVSGLGYFELTVNGQRIGDHLLDPGYTRYDRRVLYVTHDITSALRGGENVLGVMLGNGWYNVSTKAAWDFDQANWRATPRLLAEIRVEMEDGRTVSLASDDQWKTAAGPITFSSIYGGESYDARRELGGWDRPGFGDAAWAPAMRVDAPKGRLVAQAMHPIRLDRTLNPVAVTEPAPGVFVFDAGQNLTGNAEIAVEGPAGATVKMVYAERLADNGRVDQTAIAVHVRRFGPEQAFQQDEYTMKGHGVERWHSRFNYNGFRYVEVTGAPGRLTADNLKIRCFHSAVPDAGDFECSNPVLNRVWVNGRWSYHSNLFGIPTDCPHREKNGWTGDAQVAMEQGLFYSDGITVYEKWINDLADTQWITGALPGIVPTSDEWGFAFGSGPAWDSALLLVPWHLYEYYGDSTALRAHYPQMRRYVDYLTTRARDGIVSIGLADWAPAKTRTPADITDTAYYYRDTRIVAEVARQLGRTADATKYSALADAIRSAFNRRFYRADDATYGLGSQTSLGCALYFGLVDPANEARVVENLVGVIQRNDNHLDYGFLGSKYVPNALSAQGRSDVVYTMIAQSTPPSYAWQVAQGATTLWENWNGAASQNHTFFGDVNAWMMKNIGGIMPDPAAPGFRHVIIRPCAVGDLTSARAHYDSIRGRIATEWRKEADAFRLNVSIPANVTATVHVPAGARGVVEERGTPVDQAVGVTVQARQADRVVLEVGSGNYEFVAR